jgi:hypothetical protein
MVIDLKITIILSKIERGISKDAINSLALDCSQKLETVTVIEKPASGFEKGGNS